MKKLRVELNSGTLDNAICDAMALSLAEHCDVFLCKNGSEYFTIFNGVIAAAEITIPNIIDASEYFAEVDSVTMINSADAEFLASCGIQPDYEEYIPTEGETKVINFVAHVLSKATHIKPEGFDDAELYNYTDENQNRIFVETVHIANNIRNLN